MKKLIALLFATIIVIALLAGCDGMNTKAKPGTDTEPKPTITADEARADLQAWADEHPFQLGSEIEPGNDEYTVDGVEYYRFYLGIIRLGVAEILVHKETGGIFHLTSPYNDVGFEPADDWYNREHASNYMNTAEADETTGTTETAEAAAKQRNWWLGNWYGCWKITDADDTYIGRKGGEIDTWDCYAVIKIDEDGSGVIYLWDHNIELRTIELGTIEISHELDMNNEAGRVESTGGELFGYPVEDEDWVLTPGQWNDEYDHMVVIDEFFQYPDGGWITYEIWLRPWGYAVG